MNWYCDIAPGHPFHGPYHDHEYGVPIQDDRALFERLCLEIFQAGLSWLIVLKKRPALVTAFDGFDPAIVAVYDEADIERLMVNAEIIRNRRKIEAVIGNARRILSIRDAEGSFAAWINRHHPRDKDAWVKLFRQTFAFTGGEVVGEFLMSIGILPGAHRTDCPAFVRILDLDPPWRKAGSSV
ncbi:DNA-3-methyladenine glycosylase I [Magnetospirillum molischianum]|uniref:Methyladenine glycosylase n=1 Tax=Magnetospirillum molischianum DSM 120 TaxID=1150626 RepID=H8FRC8_MAGML|nr:DNA-3-methyladenine glycosylase I [Magnetospirillum molischianum]CCG40916.1 Methyladenine glycosylase [Magnetospirillum molischianum DSM 120]